MKAITLESFDKEHRLYGRVLSLGFPTKRVEQYRKFPIDTLLEKEYNFESLKLDIVKKEDTLLIDNGVLRESPKDVEVRFESYEEADLEHYDVSYFLSHIASTKTIVLEVQKDIELNIVHRFSKRDSFLNYRIVLKTSPQTKVQVYESFELQESGDSFLMYGVDTHIADMSNVTWIRYETRGIDESVVLGSHRFHVAKHGAFDLKTFDFGSANTLHLYKVDLETFARVNAIHLLLAIQNARRGNVVVINHKDTNAKSVQEARSILKDKARGVFDAKINVTKDGKYASAMQNSKAILLDEGTHMHAKPQLEIYTDELEASHGSTIGTLDEEALFYLQSRGIKLSDAKKMLVVAFANTLIDTVDDSKLGSVIRRGFEEIL